MSVWDEAEGAGRGCCESREPLSLAELCSRRDPEAAWEGDPLIQCASHSSRHQNALEGLGQDHSLRTTHVTQLPFGLQSFSKTVPWLLAGCSSDGLEEGVEAAGREGGVPA